MSGESSYGRAAELKRACTKHTDGLTTDDPTIGVCWDADRLELSRLDIRTDASYLSTIAGQRAAAGS